MFFEPYSSFLLFFFNTSGKIKIEFLLFVSFIFLTVHGARSIQPKFPEISVQNSVDRFGPTGKVSKKLVHLLRWSSFPGRTVLNFGWMDRAHVFRKEISRELVLGDHRVIFWYYYIATYRVSRENYVFYCYLLEGCYLQNSVMFL